MKHLNQSNLLIKTLWPLGFAASALACSDGAGGGTGSLTVLIEAEDVITEGIEPGDGGENIRDGWAVTFDKYLVTVGDVDLHLSSDEAIEAAAEDSFVVDLTQVSSSGLSLWHFEELASGRWEFHYATPGAAHGASRHSGTSKSDFEEMVDKDWTYLIEGVLMKEDGESCPPASLAETGDRQPNGNTSGGNDCFDAPTVGFVFGAAAETAYGPCEIDDVPGFSVPAGGTQTVAMTIHGDHLFFNGFPEGNEGGVSRRAQWLADCDLDLDGTVTQQELEAIAPAQLPAMDDYQFGGARIEPTNMYKYVRAQLKTQGHFQGEGECDLDGETHEHHDDE